MVYKDEQNQGEDLVDPEFQPLFLYEIDEESDLFESDNFSQSGSSSCSKSEDVERDLQKIVEQDEDL